MEIWISIKSEVLVHWPMLVIILICSVITQLLKTRILTAGLARKNRTVFWLRRVLPLVIILGMGFIGAWWPGETSPGVVETLPKIFYFMGGACISIVGYSVFRNWVKKKYDLDLSDGLVPPKIPYPKSKQ